MRIITLKLQTGGRRRWFGGAGILACLGATYSSTRSISSDAGVPASEADRNVCPTRRRSLALPVLVVLISTACPAQTPDAVTAGASTGVDRGLAWLKHNQQPDGSFPTGSIGGRTAITSLAVLAFLARGNLPGQGPYGDTINSGIDYVLASQKLDGAKKGLIGRDEGSAMMYEHAMATVMLAEVDGMADDARRAKIDRALALAVQLIVDSQRAEKISSRDAGGWRYALDSPDADISVTGWQLMALRGAANCGAPVPAQTLKQGADYVRRCASTKGGFAYQADDGEPNLARTGSGILSLILIAGDRQTVEVRKAADYLLANPLNHSVRFYYYAAYYDAQALRQLGGNCWQTGYPRLVDDLLTLQEPDGAFAATGDQTEAQAGPAYRTSLAVLALCVPYRYLPLYQADN